MQAASVELDPESLRNRYFALRHAESEANRQGIILSDPASGVPHFGLTEHGRWQIESQMSTHLAQLEDVERVICSDFRRTRETAEIAATKLNVELETDVALRERGFGAWERTTNDNYETVWQRDRIDPDHTENSVESVNSVARRAARCVCELDRRFDNATLLLVSHGDTLQILQCVMGRRPVSQHRDLPPLAPGELRLLTK